jgi:hypothetical protein
MSQQGIEERILHDEESSSSFKEQDDQPFYDETDLTYTEVEKAPKACILCQSQFCTTYCGIVFISFLGCPKDHGWNVERARPGSPLNPAVGP